MNKGGLWDPPPSPPTHTYGHIGACTCLWNKHLSSTGEKKKASGQRSQRPPFFHAGAAFLQSWQCAACLMGIGLHVISA